MRICEGGGTQTMTHDNSTKSRTSISEYANECVPMVNLPSSDHLALGTRTMYAVVKIRICVKTL